MARNKLIDLNNHLFAQLERLNDEELTQEEIKNEVQRAKAISGVASQVINNAKVTIDAMKLIKEDHYSKDELPVYIGIEKE